MGGYPGSNRELTVPHTVALPIELYPPYLAFNTRTAEVQTIKYFVLRMKYEVQSMKYEVQSMKYEVSLATQQRTKNKLIKSIANYSTMLTTVTQSVLLR